MADPEEAGQRKIKIIKIKIKASHKTGTGAPGTRRTHPRPAVTAITDMVRKVGTVWHPSLVHGSISALRGHEGQAGLETRKKK